ncbi:hypothetical protein BJ912DRAFT_924951, partial [Pholiota molesta]
MSDNNAEDHRCNQRQNYERMLSTSETPGVRLLRHFLGDPTIDNDTASMATNGTAQLKVKYHDRVSALLAAYRLLDLEILRLGTVPTIPTPLYPKSLTPQMVEHGKANARVGHTRAGHGYGYCRVRTAHEQRRRTTHGTNDDGAQRTTERRHVTTTSGRRTRHANESGAATDEEGEGWHVVAIPSKGASQRSGAPRTTALDGRRTPCGFAPRMPSQGTGMARASEQVRVEWPHHVTPPRHSLLSSEGSMTSAPVAFASTLAEAEHRRPCHPPPPTTARGPLYSDARAPCSSAASLAPNARSFQLRSSMHGRHLAHSRCLRSAAGGAIRPDGCLTVCVYEEHCQCSVLRHEDATWQLLDCKPAGYPLPVPVPDVPARLQTRGSTGMGIPESIAALVAGDQPVVNVAGLPLTKYDLHTREKMRDYLNDHSSGELSLPLHLSLLLTPLCLLMPVAHVKGRFRRPSLSELFGQLSRALGNEKPEILTRVENEIWKALWMINEDSSMPVIIKAFQQLADSDVFHEVVGIHATDPAFSFFRPLGNNAATSQVRSEDSTVNAFPLSQLVTP